MAEENEKSADIGEDGRPMLSFPSMDGIKSNEPSKPPKSIAPQTSIGPTIINKDVNAEVYSKIREATAESNDFYYHPDDIQEGLNREYAIKTLKDVWGGQTNDHIAIAQWFVNSYADDDVITEIHNNGTGSHPIMIESIYMAAKRMEKEGVGQIKDASTMKGMTKILIKKVGQKCRETLNRAVHDAQTRIIAKHGAIPSS